MSGSEGHNASCLHDKHYVLVTRKTQAIGAAAPIASVLESRKLPRQLSDS